jgi:hypothetical protein
MSLKWLFAPSYSPRSPVAPPTVIGGRKKFLIRGALLSMTFRVNDSEFAASLSVDTLEFSELLNALGPQHRK